MITEEVMTEKRRAELTAMLDAKSQKVQAAVAAWSARNTVAPPPVWAEVEGDRIETLVAEHGRAADLIVLVRPAETEGREALHAAIFDTGRLLLLVPPPDAAAPIRFGRHMAIAWKTSHQAAAAVMASIPWLKRAEKVSVLLIGTEPPTPAAADEALALLHPHGIDAEPVLCVIGDEDIGARLLSEAHALRADSLVMGAYRHNRIIEMIFGGVTRHMLHEADVPLFLMH
jgi:nucleotide-binding universal stress UspA family protein